ncbi:MAG: hypothetical protein OEU84_16205 [Xanthomonadales bacterium]|nr:hypothetical protein [Xanthomonadales bacterium]MDH4021136.1 hypothetical protein [Xanthomonadales bacterium]
MSFFKELKRRNVVRVGIAYTVATWLLIQVTDTVFPRIGLPDSAVTLVIALLVIGFIPALIFAWAFEMTPDGLKREKEVDRSQSITPQTGRKLDRVIIGVMTIIIAFLVLERFVLTDGDKAPAATTETTLSEQEATPIVDKGQSIAVLPFVNMSGDKDNEYFSDGLTETLLHMLAQLPDLRVAARTSSFAFKGQNTSIEDISTALNVEHILEGSVQKAGDRVRITAQLIRAGDGFHIWSQNYDRTLDDIFVIQDEIAKDVADVLDEKLLGGDTELAHVETSDAGAYDTYLRALEQQNIGSYASLATAESLFKQSLAIDPGFIDAKLGLARNYFIQFRTGLVDEAQMQQEIKAQLDQVRESQADNRLARAIELMSLHNPWSMSDQETVRVDLEELRLLLPLLPSETYIRGQTAMAFAYGLDRPGDALEIIEAGFMFDPLSAELYAMQGNVYSRLKQFEDARRSVLKAVELDPLDPNNYGRMSYISGELNDIRGVFEWRLKNVQSDPQDHEVAGHMAREFYEWGLPEEGDHWLDRVRALAPNSDILQRLLIDRALARGDTAEVIAVAEKMISSTASMRQDIFTTALLSYRLMMSKAGRYEEAYNFLVGLRPEITSFEQLPGDVQGVLMQWESIVLMSGFSSIDERSIAWEAYAQNLRANGSWWLEDPYGQAVDFLFRGDLDSAIEKAREDLAQPLSSLPVRGVFWDDPVLTPITTHPEIAARLIEMKQEKLQARKLITEMLQEPEWTK